jgi:hypothetical protein
MTIEIFYSAFVSSILHAFFPFRLRCLSLCTNINVLSIKFSYMFMLESREFFRKVKDVLTLIKSRQKGEEESSAAPFCVNRFKWDGGGGEGGDDRTRG